MGFHNSTPESVLSAPKRDDLGRAAKERGFKPDEVMIGYRTDEERDTLLLAARRGNRRTRRARQGKGNSMHASSKGWQDFITKDKAAGGHAIGVTPTMDRGERDRRNAARRVATKQRKRNRRK